MMKRASSSGSSPQDATAETPTEPAGEPAEAETIDTATTTVIVEVPDVGYTAESLGLTLPKSRDDAEALLVRELGEARQEAAELLDSLQRVAAEFDNFRKRTVRDNVENVQRAGQRVIESLLPVLDSLDAAAAVDATTENETKMLNGVRSTRDQLLEALTRDGFEPIDAVGSPFDPALHEAVSVIPGEGEQVVHQEVRKGYMMSGRVIRPSLVIVGHA